jgi:MFS family permease
MIPTAATESRLRRILTRHGVPALGGSGRLLAAAAIDSTGSGLFFAFQVIYFVSATSLPLAQVGAALTLAQLLALPSPALAGPLVDRYGPVAVAVIGNVLCGAGFLGFLAVGRWWQIVLAGLVVQVGVNLYWTASGALIALAVPERERTRWFGLIQALRNAGVAVGGALAAVAVGVGGGGALRVLVVLNAASYIAGALLTASWQRARAQPRPGTAPEPARDRASGGYLTVLRDGAYVRLLAVNLVFVLAALVLNVLLAVYLVKGLGGSAWWAGALLTVNAVLVALLQTRITQALEHRQITTAIKAGALLNMAAFIGFGLLLAAPGWLIVPGLVAAVVVYTMAEMFQSPGISSLATSMAPAALRGRYLAAYQLSWNVAGAVAPALYLSLLAIGPAWPWALLVVLSLGSVIVVTDLEKRGSRLPTGFAAPAVPPDADDGVDIGAAHLDDKELTS